MRAVIQRVISANVAINNEEYSSIKHGVLVLLGIEEADNFEDIEYLSGKISRLRIFDDENGVMNLSVSEIKAEILVVSQFTLHASTKKGNRPSYIRSAKSEISIPLYEKFVENIKSVSDVNVCTGVFGAMMQVELVNDGPVTIIIDSKNRE